MQSDNHDQIHAFYLKFFELIRSHNFTYSSLSQYVHPGKHISFNGKPTPLKGVISNLEAASKAWPNFQPELRRIAVDTSNNIIVAWLDVSYDDGEEEDGKARFHECAWYRYEKYEHDDEELGTEQGWGVRLVAVEVMITGLKTVPPAIQNALDGK